MTGRRLKLPVVLALMVSIGLHWALLQSVAWVGMVVRFSQEDSLSAAIEKTFDGQHACKLCRIVAEGKKAEQKQEAQKPGAKLDVYSSETVRIVFAPAPADRLAAPAIPAPLRVSAPPLPPPRFA